LITSSDTRCTALKSGRRGRSVEEEEDDDDDFEISEPDSFWPLGEFGDIVSLEPDEPPERGNGGRSAGGLNSGGGIGGVCVDPDRTREGRRAISLLVSRRLDFVGG
jgi:hypothetical protein